MDTILISICKALSVVGIFSAGGWFMAQPDFAAVLLGILSLSIFMMSFLPIRADKQA